jgi:hypothetical protein
MDTQGRAGEGLARFIDHHEKRSGQGFALRGVENRKKRLEPFPSAMQFFLEKTFT